MPTRREFLSTAAASVAALVPVAQGAGTGPTGLVSSTPRIRSVARRDDVILRFGDGAVSSVTWAADDRQLMTFLEGADVPGASDRYRREFFCSRMISVIGGPERAASEDLPGYPEIRLLDLLLGLQVGLYGCSTLAVEGRIYEFLRTSNRPFHFADKSTWPPAFYFNGIKLIYSDDGGRSWNNQDGSKPVERVSRENLSRKNTLFLEEANKAFSSLRFLQMGKGYQENRDGFVYVYANTGGSDGAPDGIGMFRVPKAKVVDVEAYEYYAGQAQGTATWVKDFKANAGVHTFPQGWHGDVPSVVYNAPLRTYMMVWIGSKPDPNRDHGMFIESDCKAGAPPVYLGIWIAPNPWGPWTQIHEEVPFRPAQDVAALPGSPLIIPKWISADGKSFWMSWSDYQATSGFRAAFDEARMRAVLAGDRGEYRRLRVLWKQFHPYFAFNAQRVDVIVE